MTHRGPKPAPVDEPVKVEMASQAQSTESAGGEEVILFKTATCPNCKAAAALLDKAGIAYTALNADEQPELVGKYGIKQAPTLIVPNGEAFEKFRGVSDIKGWLMNR